MAMDYEAMDLTKTVGACGDDVIPALVNTKQLQKWVYRCL